MPSPISEGRMIRKDISKSKGFAALSKESMIVLCVTIPHLNVHGKMNGNPAFVKGECLPRIDWATEGLISGCLKEISRRTNVKYFKFEGLWYIHSVNFKEHQKIKFAGIDHLPSYKPPKRGRTSEELPKNFQVTPAQVEVKVEEEVEGEVQEEVESNGFANSPKGPETAKATRMKRIPSGRMADRVTQEKAAREREKLAKWAKENGVK